MKKKNLFILSSVTIASLMIGFIKPITNETSASSSEWSNFGATLTDIANGVEISGLTWGTRAHTAALYTLDGLEFDFEFTNVASGSSAGFFFGTTHNYYAPQTGAGDDTITFTLNSSAGFYSISQNRFGTFHTHDINDKNGPQTYTDMSLSKPDGFGYSDGTCVMNLHTSQKFHFSFKKVDSTWYQMIMKDLVGQTFWTIESQKPINDSLTVYFKASQIKLDEFGRTYLFGFGFNGDGGTAPIIRFSNYQGDITAPVININKNSIDTFEGLLPDESFQAYDDVDGIVPISYAYPDGALDNNGKLIQGDWEVTLAASDKAKNETKAKITYHVGPKQNRSIAHNVNLNAAGVDVLLQKTTYFEGENVWFTLKDITESDNVTIKVINQDGTDISFKGTNPYYFKMPDNEVTLNVVSENEYITKTKLSVFDTEYISYLGRYYQKDGGMFFSNSNSGFALKIKTSKPTNKITVSLKAETTFINDTTQYAQVFVDGERTGERLAINSGNVTLDIVNNLSIGEHVLEFKKCNEAQFSNLIIKDITLDNIQIKKHNDQRPTIEFFGDSISCGYGNLASGSGFTLSTQDATQAYTNLTADALGYRSSSISYSGIGLYRSWTHSEITALSLYKQIDGQEYNMRKDNVKISVINLGTNDNTEYNTISASEKPAFIKGMKKNIKAMMNTILDCHQNSSIIIGYEMMTEISLDIVQCYNEAIEETKQMWGTSKIYLLKFDRNEQGVDGHPNLIGHQNAAQKLTSFIIDNNLN